ncbi:hypothetical protein [Neorhizobium sp. NCHU2750]|uniref:hypothetical protein n=1 Tax=Neorhizobium sp. NCHU2750 TaxID=1825976 RepID=UPI000EB62C3B|nr:hypothetical protein NCHU2750_15250 [Neorhizobium sp. NCHU2750]
MIELGYSPERYARVRDWLLSAFKVAPAVFTEAEMIDKLQSGEWHLITTDNAACVLQFFEKDGEKAANILVIGGKIGAALREIMIAHFAVCDMLRHDNFSYIVGEPRKEWHRFLLKYGFERTGRKDQFIKRL